LYPSQRSTLPPGAPNYCLGSLKHLLPYYNVKLPFAFSFFFSYTILAVDTTSSTDRQNSQTCVILSSAL
jgi:hypothetical protein